ncbi:hypothetical protein OAL67_01050 [bacterium]|nr:hypothetical protein [bacterium]
MKIKNFIQRNLPVFVVSLITLSVFVVLIITSLSKNTPETQLVRVDSSEVNFEETEQPVEPPVDINALIQEVEESTESTPSAPEGVTLIRFVDGRFLPRNSIGKLGKVVMWKNETDRTISIKQLAIKFDEFSEPVEIGPNDYFVLTLSDTGMWTFKEIESDAFGSVFIEK